MVSDALRRGLVTELVQLKCRFSGSHVIMFSLSVAGEFDYDSLWGRKALQRLYMVLLEQIAPPVFPSSGIVNSYSSFPAFCEEERRQMLGVGMIKSSVDARQLRSIVNDGAGMLSAKQMCDSCSCIGW